MIRSPAIKPKDHSEDLWQREAEVVAMRDVSFALKGGEVVASRPERSWENPPTHGDRSYQCTDFGG